MPLTKRHLWTFIAGMIASQIMGANALASDPSNPCENQINTLPTKIEGQFNELQSQIGKGSTTEEAANTGKSPPCVSIDLRKAQARSKCMTSKGAIYERVTRERFGEAWKDQDGTVWSDLIKASTRNSAENICKKLGGRLPSRADFERGAARGIAEVLPNLKKRWFWAKSVNPYYRDFGYYFSGTSTSSKYQFSRRKEMSDVRCIGSDTR